MSYRIGIDVGGTFTDFVVYDTRDKEIQTLKVPTTPEDPSIGIANGFDQLGISPEEINGIAHGTTTATNALIERRGANTAFLTTKGFRDTLEIRRNDRKELYDAQWRPPAPLVRRRNRIEINERVMWDGVIDQPLDEEQVKEVIEVLKARDIEAVAVCFLHSYEHPAHEERIKEMLEEALPEAFVSISSELSQEFREFERSSTVAANAFVGPKVSKYMSNLQTRLEERNLPRDISIMQSNGGVCTVEEAASFPAKLARSGPAGGAMALERIAELTGMSNLVSIDIGGTSADVALIVDNRTRWSSPLRVEWGMPLLLPSVDVISIGAGGGSIAWIDEGGSMRMGPQSAGADPGPACYGIGGTEPTSTDAHLVLGRVSSDEFAKGSMKLDRQLAEDAIRSRIAEPLGLGVNEAAEGMLTILDTNMLQAVRLVTVERGYDPRDFVLVGLGGGGPLHVAELARELGISTALVPTSPGVLSAWGMLTVDMVEDGSRTVLKRRKATSNEELRQAFIELRNNINDAFTRQQADHSKVEYEYIIDLQYFGQVFSLAISLEGVEDSSGDIVLTDAIMAEAEEKFHVEHEREYGHSDRGQEIQIVNVRVFGRAKVEKAELRESKRTESADALTGTRDVVFDGESVPTSIYSRDALAPGSKVAGPAIIVESSSTTVIPPGAEVEVDKFENLIIQV